MVIRCTKGSLGRSARIIGAAPSPPSRVGQSSPMPECRQHAFIDAPLNVVWGLASDPDRQTEWWPDTITFECIDGPLEQGCHVRNVQKRPWPMPELETTLEVDRMVPGKELTIRCMDTGTYTRSVLTEGQGGTFIEMEAGNDP